LNNISKSEDSILYCDKTDCRYIKEDKCRAKRVTFIDGRCIKYKKK
jgi:hypothetical protein